MKKLDRFTHELFIGCNQDIAKYPYAFERIKMDSERFREAYEYIMALSLPQIQS